MSFPYASPADALVLARLAAVAFARRACALGVAALGSLPIRGTTQRLEVCRARGWRPPLFEGILLPERRFCGITPKEGIPWARGSAYWRHDDCCQRSHRGRRFPHNTNPVSYTHLDVYKRQAENCTATMHNLYTLRGAEVRDGNAWANYLMETLARYGDLAEVTFQAHNWPHWGAECIREYLMNTAAMYKFIADQTLMYLNQGLTSNEIAHLIQLPSALERSWYTRQYYGTVAHNAKAVYQKYMGWYLSLIHI